MSSLFAIHHADFSPGDVSNDSNLKSNGFPLAFTFTLKNSRISSLSYTQTDIETQLNVILLGASETTGERKRGTVGLIQAK
jgi:hypothetical protein